jgi:hypothetical protein
MDNNFFLKNQNLLKDELSTNVQNSQLEHNSLNTREIVPITGPLGHLFKKDLLQQTRRDYMLCCQENKHLDQR